ncbi:glycosyl hydrolase family 76 [Diplodia corticola]|uniref:Mannan endo-1,6-alpha-mannosidase n=1 Tax=Diplodia corticola TaxID=236234 RepID=A0A1J9R3F6_9PEZI|nr:glycosyl hydrolase family 76 [Diplodia corticola]OJD35966.1 glycosyl hydrolase family 76 [Diplodia corticola]
MFPPLSVTLGAAILLSSHATQALQLDITQAQSIRDASSNIAFGMMSWYTGNNTGDVPGNLPDPYYWWHAGAMFMTMVDYAYLTGDETYVDVTKQAILHQAGDTWDFMPQNQTKSEGNDDQLFWALAAMSAAETRFPDPSSGQASWVAQVQNVFELQTSRWDETSCGGGLRWQIFTWNKGYDYKNTISNGGLFQLAARLARYTGDAKYTAWAAKVWDWSASVLFQRETSTAIVLSDGATTASPGCSRTDPTQWTYIYGVYLAGAAYLHNHTGDPLWAARADKLLATIEAQFFVPSSNVPGPVMAETTCEPSGGCDIDQQSFKAYLARWMSLTAQLVPATADRIFALLRPTALGAARQCSGGGEGPRNAPDACGRRWDQSAYDGTSGMCEQMAALQAVAGVMMVPEVGAGLAAPASLVDGGATSKTKEDGGAGVVGGKGGLPAVYTEVVTAGDRAGAAILTILLCAATLGVGYAIV